MLEKQVEYVIMAVQKMQRERIKSMEVRDDAVADWEEYMEHYFPKVTPCWFRKEPPDR